MERYGMLVSKEEDQPWKYNHRRGLGSLYSNGVMTGFSWPLRSYGCSFCKREFRSAQALGGHMNVHRRERARLRQYSPPWVDTPPIPNPNSNTNHSKTSIPNLNVAEPTSPPFPPCSPPSPSSPLSDSPPTSTQVTTQDQVKFSLFGHHYTLLKTPVPFYEETELVVEEQNTMRLELAMGHCQDDHLEDGLDLELRLGSS